MYMSTQSDLLNCLTERYPDPITGSAEGDDPPITRHYFLIGKSCPTKFVQGNLDRYPINVLHAGVKQRTDLFLSVFTEKRGVHLDQFTVVHVTSAVRLPIPRRLIPLNGNITQQWLRVQLLCVGLLTTSPRSMPQLLRAKIFSFISISLRITIG